jgi:hypothetical protein
MEVLMKEKSKASAPESKFKGAQNQKHTPGPWRWLPDEGNFIVRDNYQRSIVAEIPCQGCNPADGPLIASAPELLEACKYVADKLSDPGLVNVLEAAIAKAEGR